MIERYGQQLVDAARRLQRPPTWTRAFAWAFTAAAYAVLMAVLAIRVIGASPW